MTPSSSFEEVQTQPVVALDGVGNGVVVYQQAVGVNFYTYASTFQADSFVASLNYRNVPFGGNGWTGKAVAAWRLGE